LLRGSVLAAALLAVIGGSASAQTVPATKVGFVNMGLLFTKYVKAETFKKELETELAPLKEQAEKIKDAMKKHEEWLRNKANWAQNPAQKEISEKAMRDGARALEDLDLQARKLVGKKQEAQLVQLYREIQGGVQQFAQQNGYHVIIGYGDPPNATDLYTFGNVNRWMTGMDMGGSRPIYIQTGLDVSNEVLARLNGGGLLPATPTNFQK
jgi:Skp family chaperone for outer membrane proteins